MPAHVQTLSGGQRIIIGWDLAHAVGNIPLRMHEWGADFAAFCSYKYLNSGAGGLSGFFVHSKHANTSMEGLPRLAGWWGVPFENRFKMAHKFECSPGAPGFMCSNVSPFLVACVKTSLELFAEAGGVAETRRKSILLTGYLEWLLRHRKLTPESVIAEQSRGVEIVTPADSRARGCQLSLRVVSKGTSPLTMRTLEERLDASGVTTDTREPDILRVAPCPLYNSFSDVWRFVEVLRSCLGE